MTAELVAFLRAQLDEDERVARAASPGPWTYRDIESVGGGRICDPTVAIASVDWDVERVDPRIRRTRPGTEADATGEHIARHDPARVLREVAAKRAIVERVAEDAAIADDPLRSQAASTAEWWLVMQARDVLRHLASVYADRPGYREEWKP